MSHKGRIAYHNTYPWLDEYILSMYGAHFPIRDMATLIGCGTPVIVRRLRAYHCPNNKAAPTRVRRTPKQTQTSTRPPRRMPKGSVVAQYWLTGDGVERFPANPALVDIGEPVCMACSRPLETPTEYLGSLAAWSYCAGQRAHMVPRNLGGSDDPSNIVILCSACHIEAPDFADNGEAMIEWMTEREDYWKYLAHTIEQANDDFGPPDKRRNLKKAFAIETKKMSVHGTGITRATETAAVRAAIKAVAIHA